MAKVLYFDTETTGLDPVRNDIIQLAMIVEIDGKIISEHDIKCQPFDYSTITPDALKTHGMTVEQIKTFQEPMKAFGELMDVLDKHIDKFDRSDKFCPAGYNITFDGNFLSSFYKKARPHDKYGIASYLNFNVAFDLLVHFRNKAFCKGPQYPNLRLSTVCAEHKIELKAHDALSDVRATRELIKQYMHEFF